MCGIAGFTTCGADRPDARVLSAMCAALRHRGPDDEGCFVDDRFALGMRRLAVIDPRDGAQPMTAQGGRYVLVYNGETYNFEALREPLMQAGVRFRTRSDTEVVLRTLAMFGTDGLARLNGMFALALLDTHRRRLILCRDPVGIKTLYYYHRPGGVFVFASELKALLLHPAVSRTVDPAALWHYLTYEYVPGPQTPFEHVYRLPPGHWLAWQDGLVSLHAYRDFPLRQGPDGDIEQSVAEFSTLFESVVASQMVADVPVGVFLSGGLDSSAVAAAAARHVGRRLKTFCIGFKEPTLADEAAAARETAAFLGVDHHEEAIDCRAYLDAVPIYVESMDEPNADMAGIGKWFACRLAARHVKVVLSGEGGDEMLGGYRLNEAMARFDQLRALQRLPKRLACDLPAGLLALTGCDRLAGRLRDAFLPLDVRGAHVLPSMTRRYSEAEKTALFRERPPGAGDSMAILRACFERARPLAPLGQIQYAWSKQWLAEHLLMQADRMSMRESLELRVPMLDTRLADFLLPLPDAHKIRKIDGCYRTKYLLRRYLEGRVPEAVLTRPKRGFQIPNVRFVRRDLRAAIGDAIAGPDARIAAFFRPEAVRERLRRVDRVGSELDCQKVWSLYILEMWCRQWTP